MKRKIKTIIGIQLLLFVLPALILISVIAAFSQQQQAIMQKKGQMESTTSLLSGIPDFITSEMIIAALETQEKYGYPASVCIAQIIIESGFGKYGPGGEEGKGLSYLAYEYKNLFGIKGKQGTAGGVSMSTQEQTSSGDGYTIDAWFRAYHTYTECIEDRAKILTEVYSDLISGVTDADTFAEKIATRWATAVSYSDVLKTCMKQYDLYRLDSMSVSDYMNGSGSSSGASADGMPYFYQTDYAHISYGSSTLAACGCGPTCFSMVASAITGKQITPDQAVAWCGNRFYVRGSGTSWSYFSAAAKHFNLGVSITQLSPSSPTSDTVLQALRDGKAVICSQTRGLFTRRGHFIVLAGIDENGKVIVHDPNKNNAINKGYNNRRFDFYSEINVTALQYFIF